MPSDTPVLDTVALMTAASLDQCDLPADTHLLIRLAALAAVDARPASYLAHIGPSVEAGVTLEDVQNVLVAVAPIIGTARVVSAAINISEALGFAIAVIEADEAEMRRVSGPVRSGAPRLVGRLGAPRGRRAAVRVPGGSRRGCPGRLRRRPWWPCP